jgi:hypothetical protein
VTVRPIFAWYDLWIGVFIDRAKRRVYVFPLPCLGLVVEWGRPPAHPWTQTPGDPNESDCDVCGLMKDFHQ